MAKFTVCIKTVVNVVVEDVEAESCLEALQKAEKGVDFEALFNENGAYAGAHHTSHGDEHTAAIVDRKPDDYDHTFTCKPDGTWTED